VKLHEVIDRLYVGGDESVPEAKRRGFARLSVAKEGPDGHRQMLGYTTLGAPKGDHYLWAREGDHMALNVLDLEDPGMIPDEALDKGLRFIREQYDKGKSILVHCNQGHSRGPTMMLMFLRTIGEMPDSFHRAEKIFRTLYPKYDPGVGMRTHAHERWTTLPNFK